MNKVAMVTGAGTGIGQATAIRLAKAGYDVAVCYSRSKDGAQATADVISKLGRKAVIYQADIKNENDVVSLFACMMTDFKRLDVVINNAGIGHYGKVSAISMDEFDRIFAVNSRGTFMMCREAAKAIQDGGSIINISTGATTANMEGQSLYTASKLAVEGFTKVLARELGSRQISVNIVSPGMTDTPLLAGGNAEALKGYAAKTAAMKRCGEPDDIAAAIVSLVSPDCAWITGQNIRIDGGSVII